MDFNRKIDNNEILKLLPKQINDMHIKKEKRKRELVELERKEKNAIKKLMEAQLQTKRDNEALLKATQRCLAGLIQKLNERKTMSEILMKEINQKRHNSFLIDMLDQETTQYQAKITKHIMEKIEDQTEIIEKKSIILKRTNMHEESTKHFRSKINELESDIVNKENELNYELNVYTGLNKVCQEMYKNNVKEFLKFKEIDEKAVSLQLKIESLNRDIKKLSMI